MRRKPSKHALKFKPVGAADAFAQTP